MAGVNTQVEVGRGKNPKEPLVPVVKGKTFKKVQAGSSRQMGNQGSSKQIKQKQQKSTLNYMWSGSCAFSWEFFPRGKEEILQLFKAKPGHLCQSKMLSG